MREIKQKLGAKQQGFSLIAVIAVVAVLVVVGTIGWSVYSNKKIQTNSQSQTASQIQQAKTPANKQPDAKQAVAQAPAQTQAQVDPNAGYVVIKEWGVRFKAEAGLEGLVYFKPTSYNNNEDLLTFTTKKLSDLEPKCRLDSTDMVFGLLRRASTPPEVVEGQGYGPMIGHIDGYYYQYRGSDSACSQNRGNWDYESKVRMGLERSLKTLEAAK